MAKFKFQLESVEKVRAQKEQKMLEELSASQRKYLEKIAEKKALLEKKQSAFTRKNEMISRDANISEVQLLEEYIEGLKYHIVRADQAIVRARRFLDQAMKKYIIARREKMMVEKLREKALEEFKVTQSRLEQKQIDDLITMRARLNHGPIDLEEEIA